MGFWDSFFGHAAVEVAKDMKRQEKETQRWNDLFHELRQYETVFNNYLSSVGIQDVYIADVEYVNSGNIMPAKREMDALKKKVEKFISLGGQGKHLSRLEDIDEAIEIIKYLKEKKCLNRQQEFLSLGLLLTQSTLERELCEETVDEEDALVISADNMNQLSGVEFEKVCQALVENMGFETKTTKASGDGGIDLIAYNYEPLLSGKYIIQCKRYKGSVGEPILRDLYGVVTSERANKGILMTTGHFTKSAIAFAEGKPLELIDGKAMLALLKKYETSLGFIYEKSFEELKEECVRQFTEELDSIIEDLTDTRSREEKFLDDLTLEEKVEYEKKVELAHSEIAREQNKVLNNPDVGGYFVELLKKVQDRDGYYVSDEIASHYIDHMNCIFQIVTDQTTMKVYDVEEKEVFSQVGTVFYWIHTKEPVGVAKVEDIINKNSTLVITFEFFAGIEHPKYKMDIANNFDIKTDDAHKILTLTNGEHKVVIDLPYENDYKNAMDYLYILKNTNAF